MTASQLFQSLTAAGVTILTFGGKLCLTGPVPPALLPACQLLKTGLVALSSGRSWWGCDGLSGHWVRLDTRQPIPDAVTLLACEGAAKWDRVPSAARLDCPPLFAAASPPKGVKR